MADGYATASTVVVTGASGWLGRSLVQRLSSVGTDTLALVQHLDDVARSFDALPGVRVVQTDVTDPASLDAALRTPGDGPVDVVHAAGLIHPRRVRDLFEVNAQGTGNVLDAARRSGVRRVIHVSSNSPFGTNPRRTDRFRNDEPFHPYLAYGRSKMMAELAVRAACDEGLDAVIVRPPWFYGPNQPARQTSFFRMVRAGRFPVFGDGRQLRSMVYVGNLVDGVLAAAARGRTGAAYWIADRRPYEVHEIVTTVQAALRAEGLDSRDGCLRVPTVVSSGAELADRAMQRVGAYQQAVHVLGEMSKTIVCDVDRSRSELGWEPQVELFDGMRHSIRWCLDRGMTL